MTWKRTGSRMVTAYEITLDRAEEIIRKLLEETPEDKGAKSLKVHVQINAFEKEK